MLPNLALNLASFIPLDAARLIRATPISPTLGIATCILESKEMESTT